MKKFTVILLMLMCAGVVHARKARITRVYIFGIVTSFQDSTVVMTDVQTLDSVFVAANGALAERNMYSYQLETFFENHKNMPGCTCAVFWNEKRERVEKDFVKLRRRFTNDKTTYLKQLDAGEFSFEPVEHIGM